MDTFTNLPDTFMDQTVHHNFDNTYIQADESAIESNNEVSLAIVNEQIQNLSLRTKIYEKSKLSPESRWEKLGEGGFGKVFKAYYKGEYDKTDKNIDETIIIKQITYKSYNDKDFRAQLSEVKVVLQGK